MEYIHDRLDEVRDDASMAIRDINDHLTSIEDFIQGGAHGEGLYVDDIDNEYD